MTITKEALLQLIEAQKQDSVLDRLRASMAKIPPAIQKIRSQVERERTALNESKARALGLEKKKKELEISLAQKEEDAKKHQKELNQVKTNEAFKALQNEIERAKKEGSEIETEILESMDELDQCRRQEKGIVAELKTFEDKARAEIGVHEAELRTLEGELERARARRDEIAGPLPPDLMKIYEHIRSRGKLDAVVPIEGELCSACRITLAPQVVVEAHKARALITCESCQRILYRREILAPKKDAAPA